jgi:hypothetical protein
MSELQPVSSLLDLLELSKPSLRNCCLSSPEVSEPYTPSSCPPPPATEHPSLWDQWAGKTLRDTWGRSFTRSPPRRWCQSAAFLVFSATC